MKGRSNKLYIALGMARLRSHSRFEFLQWNAIYYYRLSFITSIYCIKDNIWESQKLSGRWLIRHPQRLLCDFLLYLDMNVLWHTLTPADRQKLGQ